MKKILYQWETPNLMCLLAVVMRTCTNTATPSTFPLPFHFKVLQWLNFEMPTLRLVYLKMHSGCWSLLCPPTVSQNCSGMNSPGSSSPAMIHGNWCTNSPVHLAPSSGITLRCIFYTISQIFFTRIKLWIPKVLTGLKMTLSTGSLPFPVSLP